LYGLSIWVSAYPRASAEKFSGRGGGKEKNRKIPKKGDSGVTRGLCQGGKLGEGPSNHRSNMI